MKIGRLDRTGEFFESGAEYVFDIPQEITVDKHSRNNVIKKALVRITK